MNYIDIHSHILPGIDDGSKDMEMSLEMLRVAKSEGINIMFATSHNMPGKGIHTRESIHRRTLQLQEKALEEGIDIRIIPGTEYYYREEVVEYLEDNKQISFGESEYMLLEFDPMVERSYIRNAVREVTSFGFTPVIAHVERYEMLTKQRDYEGIYRLRDLGALIQVNAGVITGSMGFMKKQWVKGLLKKELVDFVATDAHRAEGGRAPLMKECARYLYRKYPGEYVDALLFGNAKKYFLGEE